MHTHSSDARELALYASHGVLTILNLGWSADAFVETERHRFGSGELFGPVVFEGRLMNNPYGSRSGISSIAQGRDTVRYAKAIGYEFIKAYSFLPDSIYRAIMQEAAAVGMTVIGHQTYGVGLARGLEAGLRMIVHAEELGPTIGVPLTEAGADSTVRLLKEAGAWLTPTLSTFEAITRTWGNPAQLDAYIFDATLAHLPATAIARWRSNGYHRQNGSVADRNAAYVEITRRLHRAGVPMLAGTDGPGIPGMLPGIAIHDELRLLQSIGMSRYDALAAATSNPGRFIAQYAPGRPRFGTVSVGARADLLVTSANPLEDLETLREPELVVRLGRVFTIAQRDSIRKSLH
jgi:imidazolonepropionase-like amidohydrolase